MSRDSDAVDVAIEEDVVRNDDVSGEYTTRGAS